MSAKTYQSHTPEAEGVTDSQHKLERLKLPADLTGKAVLDIGCNEGFFCNVAAERGAKRVVGVDFIGKAIEFARTRYTNPVIDFRHQSWSTLPEGPFDLVIWASAMHYELNPKSVLENIGARLSPNGLLVLECGVAPGSDPEMVMSQRHDATLWYPTESHLQRNLLKNFSFRQVSPAEQVGTDPVPRRVFHIQNRLPIVLLIRGASGDGKSTAAESIRASATQLINLDMWFYRVVTSQYHHDPLSQFIRDYKNDSGLTSLYYGIDVAGFTDEFAKLVTKGIGASDQLVLIEGALTGPQIKAITMALESRARVWQMERRTLEYYNRLGALLDGDA